MRLFQGLFLSLAVPLTLVACHQDHSSRVSGGHTPHAAVQSLAKRLKQNDMTGFWINALPPADYANMRTDWCLQQQQHYRFKSGEKLIFNLLMQQLTAPSAPKRLYAKLEPELNRLQKKYQDQIPVLSGIVQIIASTGITQSGLTGTQKKQASAMLAVVLSWFRKTPWFDPAKASQALSMVVDTAHRLDLKNLDELRTLDFDVAMKKYAGLFGCFKELVAIYGLSLDDTFASVKAGTLRMDHDRAQVQVNYLLLGKPLHTQVWMERINDRWYDTALVRYIRKMHRQWQQRVLPVSIHGVPATVSRAAATKA